MNVNTFLVRFLRFNHPKISHWFSWLALYTLHLSFRDRSQTPCFPIYTTHCIIEFLKLKYHRFSFWYITLQAQMGPCISSERAQHFFFPKHSRRLDDVRFWSANLEKFHFHLGEETRPSVTTPRLQLYCRTISINKQSKQHLQDPLPPPPARGRFNIPSRLFASEIKLINGGFILMVSS